MIAEETRDLLRRAQAGDTAAAEQMVTENTGLIWSVARRFFGRGVEPDDLYQLGCVGFLKAMQGFDERYGTCFSTYAVPKISGEIRRFLRDDGAVKVSRSIKERAQGIRTARTRLEQALGREPTLSELSAETGLEPEEIAAAETATGPTESLQKESGETGFTLEHMLGDYDQEERMVEYAALREALRQLPERERQVIALRFYHALPVSCISHRCRCRAWSGAPWSGCANGWPPRQPEIHPPAAFLRLRLDGTRYMVI